MTKTEKVGYDNEIDINDPAALEREYGSLEALKKEQEAYKQRKEQERTIEPNKALVNYTKRLNMVKEEKFCFKTELQKTRMFFARKIGAASGRPQWLTYETARPLFWEAYKQVVFRDKGVIPILDGNMKTVVPNVVKWLINDPMGKYNLNKSLYLWGELGVGKSALAEAAFWFLENLRLRHAWDEKEIKFSSLDEAFFQVYTSKSLEGFAAFATGNWILDELKAKHLKYKHFGNDIYLIDDLLTVRYNQWKKGAQTIITSNIPSKQLAKVLTENRTFDRVREQYNIVNLKGANKRHLKDD